MTTPLPAIADDPAGKDVVVPPETAWAQPCPECGTPIDRRFCPACGERRLDASDLRLGALIREGVEDAVNLDGRFPRTLRDLLLRPGELTRAWVEGRRMRYARPLTLFLTLNVVFFLVIANLNVLRWPLQGYRDNGTALGTASGATLGRLADARAGARGLTPAAFERRFDGALRDRQKASLVVVIPLFALALGGVLAARRWPAVQHLVFSTHFYAFFLLWFGIGTIGLVSAAYAAARRVGGPLLHVADFLGSETGFTLLVLGGSALYLEAALRRAYELSRRRAVVAAVALALVVGTLVLVLKDLLFVVTLYTV